MRIDRQTGGQALRWKDKNTNEYTERRTEPMGR